MVKRTHSAGGELDECQAGAEHMLFSQGEAVKLLGLKDNRKWW